MKDKDKRDTDSQFSRKIISKIRLLTDLLQVEAIQDKRSDLKKNLRRLINEFLGFVTLAAPDNETIENGLLSSFESLIHAFLGGVSKIAILSELAAEWVRNSHDILFEKEMSGF